MGGARRGVSSIYGGLIAIYIILLMLASAVLYSNLMVRAAFEASSSVSEAVASAYSEVRAKPAYQGGSWSVEIESEAPIEAVVVPGSGGYEVIDAGGSRRVAVGLGGDPPCLGFTAYVVLEGGVVKKVSPECSGLAGAVSLSRGGGGGWEIYPGPSQARTLWRAQLGESFTVEAWGGEGCRFSMRLQGGGEVVIDATGGLGRAVLGSIDTAAGQLRVLGLAACAQGRAAVAVALEDWSGNPVVFSATVSAALIVPADSLPREPPAALALSEQSRFAGYSRLNERVGIIESAVEGEALKATRLVLAYTGLTPFWLRATVTLLEAEAVEPPRAEYPLPYSPPMSVTLWAYSYYVVSDPFLTVAQLVFEKTPTVQVRASAGGVEVVRELEPGSTVWLTHPSLSGAEASLVVTYEEPPLVLSTKPAFTREAGGFRVESSPAATPIGAAKPLIVEVGHGGGKALIAIEALEGTPDVASLGYTFQALSVVIKGVPAEVSGEADWVAFPARLEALSALAVRPGEPFTADNPGGLDYGMWLIVFPGQSTSILAFVQ